MNRNELASHATTTNTTQDWRHLATCRSHDPELFFPNPTEQARNADAVQICRTLCPVRTECLEYAVQAGIIHGVWGGTTEPERAKARRRTNRVRLNAERHDQTAKATR